MPTKSSTNTPGAPGTISNTGVNPTSPNNSPLTSNTSIGFSPFSLQYLQFTNIEYTQETVTNKGNITNVIQAFVKETVSDIPVDFRAAINNVYLQKNMIGPSLMTIQMTDPNRELIKQIGQGGILQQGTTVSIIENGKSYNFILMQFVKASDQIQLIFESNSIYTLSHQRGTIAQSVTTAVTEFIQARATEVNPLLPQSQQISFLGPDYATVWNQLTGNSGKPIVKIGLGRGTTADPAEDSWTAMSRIASGVGWRLWEDENVVYFGPDEYWLGLLTKDANGNAVPPINALFNKNAEVKKIHEFSDQIQLIDFDWDIGKPYAQATVTAMLQDWQFHIGEVVEVTNLGIGNGYWLVSSMQRDLYNPQASLTLQVPMPFSAVLTPTSAPLPGMPLVPNKIV
jgi:hypothetical protein